MNLCELDGLLGRELVLIGDLILTEVLQGFRTEAGYREARALLDPLGFVDWVAERLRLQPLITIG